MGLFDARKMILYWLEEFIWLLSPFIEANFLINQFVAY